MKSFFKKHRAITIFIIMTLILTLTSCNKAVDTEKSTAEIPNKITISGLDKEDINVSIDDIKELEKVNKDVVAVTASGEKNEMNVSGGLLEELLQKYSKSQKDFSAIRFVALDGYSIDIPSEILKNRDIILTYEIDGEPLFEESKPLRIVIPDERAMYWVRSLSKIEIIGGREEKQANKQTNKIIIFDTVISNLKQEDYEYYESMDKVIRTDELLKKFAMDNVEDEIFIKAADGLEKGESNQVFKDAYIKTTGKEAPMFLSPDMPKGMTVKNILWFSAGNTSFLSMDKVSEYFEEASSDNIKGVFLKDIMNDINLSEGDTYIFSARDGYSVEILPEDIGSGILYKNEEDSIEVYFPDLKKNKSVKDLLSIEVK